MSGALVDALNRFLARSLREAEDVTGHWVRPGVLEVHRLLVLDRQVGAMSLEQCFSRNPGHVGVDVHELAHGCSFRAWFLHGTPTPPPRGAIQNIAVNGSRS